MIPRELPCIRTHVDAPALYSALGDALWDMLDEQPKRESVLCLLAQWGVESGGGASQWCWNLTNIRSRDGDGRNWTFIPSCSEIVNGREVHYTREANPGMCRFRAYETLADGVADYLATLKRQFVTAWAEMLDGDPSKFAFALHADRFYTASPKLYGKALCEWYARLDKSLPTV